MMDVLTFAYVFSGLVSALGIALILPQLRKAVLDSPNSRSSHSQAVPRGGGLAVSAAWVTGTAIFADLGNERLVVLMLATAAMCALGFADDLWSLSPNRRLLITALVSTIVAATFVDGAGTDALLISLAGCVLLVGYTNSFNFMDGINGISSLSATLAGLWLCGVAWSHDLFDVAVYAAALAGAAIGFLPWNAIHARVFLGDAGSYALGFGIGAIAFWILLEGAGLALVAPPLLIYVADTGAAVLKRVVGRRPWMEAHREHVYQRIVDSGQSHLTSSTIVVGFGLILCVMGYALRGSPDFVWASATAVILASYLTLPHFFGLRRR